MEQFATNGAAIDLKKPRESYRELERLFTGLIKDSWNLETDSGMAESRYSSVRHTPLAISGIPIFLKKDL